jgi:putative DNA primase/helicase
VLLNTWHNILGDYAVIAPMGMLTETKSERHPADLAMLRGARTVIAQEVEAGSRWAETRIKALTGGDPVSARFMRQDFFTYVPQFKLLVAGNHKPKLREVNEAMRRRLHFIPFSVTVAKGDRDPKLSEKL